MQVHQPIQKEQKALQELKYREDIVKTNADKGQVVVIIDLKDCMKKSEI